MSDVVILGGGYAGLAAALRLGSLGVPSTLLEASPALGGLASCVKMNGVTLESLYHHIKPDESLLIGLIGDLGLTEDLLWHETRMGFYVDGSLYGFSSPFDLLRFRPFGLTDKFRFALGTFKAKHTESDTLRGLDARAWIHRNWGSRIYELMLGPMLQNKFGVPGEEISAGFLHGRIKGLARTKSNVRSGERLGYLHGSLEPLTRRLAAKIADHTDIRTSFRVEIVERHSKGFRVEGLGLSLSSSHIINTLPLSVFEGMKRNFDFSSGIAYQGAVVGIYMIREELTDFYWINIIDDGIPFKVVVNQSVMDDYPCTVLYCGRYLRPEDPLFDSPPDEIAAADIASLGEMFGDVSVIDSTVFKTRHGTPVFDSGFGRKKEYIESQVPGMLFAGNAEVYPHMRTVNNVVETGFRAAENLAAQLNAS